MKVYLLGDSHTAGSFGQRLESLLVASGVTVARRGMVGWGIGQWADLLESSSAAVPDRDADAILVALGHNDWGRARSIAPQVDRLATILEESSLAPLVWIGPPASKTSDPTDTAAAIASALDRRGAADRYREWIWIDSLPLTVDLKHTADGIHFDKKNGSEWANRVWLQVPDGDTLSGNGGGGGGGFLAAAGLLALGGLSLWRWLRRRK